MSTTDDPSDPRLTHGVDDEPTPQAETYLVLTEAERAQGFVRPLRRAYQHTGGCGAVTTIALPIAETFARRPDFYGSTYCTGCHMHRRVGDYGEFTWLTRDGEPSSDKVGS